MNIDIDVLSRFIEISVGVASSIFFFIVMVYRLSYKVCDLADRFKEHNKFVKEFKKSFDDFKFITSQQIAEIKLTINSIEKKIDNHIF